MNSPGRHAGITLAELLVVLAILGAMAWISGLAFRGPEWFRHDLDPLGAEVRAARRSAATQRRPVTVTVWREDRPAAVTALPDGRVVADSGVVVDLFEEQSNATR
jgi:prepilin-type N-terminal cleavage/methylation domain-containing protein